MGSSWHAGLDCVLMILMNRSLIFLSGFLIQFLVEFQWNALRALPSASLCFDLELVDCGSGVL